MDEIAYFGRHSVVRKTIVLANLVIVINIYAVDKCIFTGT